MVQGRDVNSFVSVLSVCLKKYSTAHLVGACFTSFESRDMSLYKSAVAGTKKVRLGASTCVSALPSELVGILLENAAMLGPDYIVDRQEVGDI